MNLIDRILERFGYYRISNLVAGGHCGVCGDWVPDAVVPADWPWTTCNKCYEEVRR